MVNVAAELIEERISRLLALCHAAQIVAAGQEAKTPGVTLLVTEIERGIKDLADEIRFQAREGKPSNVVRPRGRWGSA